MKQDLKIKKNMRSILKIHTNEVVGMKEFIIFILDIFTGGWVGYFFERKVKKEIRINNETKENKIVKSKFVCKLLLGTCGARGCSASLS